MMPVEYSTIAKSGMIHSLYGFFGRNIRPEAFLYKFLERYHLYMAFIRLAVLEIYLL